MTNKSHIYKSYENIADWFDEHRSRELFEKPYLDMVITRLKPGAKILDLGCGMGEPIANYFIQMGFRVTGVDGSQKLIALAKSRFPTARFFIADMREINLAEKFDCILAWHSFFHLPPHDQHAMFKRFEEHIMPGGMLLFTTGPAAAEEWCDNGGEDLYHASLDPFEYKELLVAHHFELITHKINDLSCGGATVWMAYYDPLFRGNKL